MRCFFCTNWRFEQAYQKCPSKTRKYLSAAIVIAFEFVLANLYSDIRCFSMNFYQIFSLHDLKLSFNKPV
jgi:hypothetical protein